MNNIKDLQAFLKWYCKFYIDGTVSLTMLYTYQNEYRVYQDELDLFNNNERN